MVPSFLTLAGNDQLAMHTVFVYVAFSVFFFFHVSLLSLLSTVLF